MQRWRVYLENLISHGHLGYRMYVMRADDAIGENCSVVTGMTFKAMPAHSFVPIDDATMDDSKAGGPSVASFLQAMADAAWDVGIRPRQVADHSSELKAVRDHLQDMRRLAKVAE